MTPGETLKNWGGLSCITFGIWNMQQDTGTDFCVWWGFFCVCSFSFVLHCLFCDFHWNNAVLLTTKCNTVSVLVLMNSVLWFWSSLVKLCGVYKFVLLDITICILTAEAKLTLCLWQAVQLLWSFVKCSALLRHILHPGTPFSMSHHCQNMKERDLSSLCACS